MIRQIPIDGFDDNFSYFIESGKNIAVVDPGDVDHLIAEINQDELIVKMILITHSHADHVSGVVDMAKKYGVPVYIHKNAKGRLEIMNEMVVFVEEGEEIVLGGLKIKVMHTPGHIDDAVCFYVKDDGHLITGDTVFVEGCGRADLDGSDVEELWKSIKRIKALPNDTKIYPGHDYGSKPVSTVGFEKKHNRFFKCEDFEAFRKVRMGY